MERGGRNREGRERWRGEGVVESDGRGKGGVVDSDGGERVEWWTVLNGGRGKGWGLMEGEGVLLGHVICVRTRRPICGQSLCVGGASSSSKGGASSSVGGGRRLVPGGGSIRGWSSSFVGVGRWVVGGLVHMGGCPWVLVCCSCAWW